MLLALLLVLLIMLALPSVSLARMSRLGQPISRNLMADGPGLVEANRAARRAARSRTQVLDSYARGL